MGGRGGAVMIRATRSQDGEYRMDLRVTHRVGHTELVNALTALTLADS